MYRPCTLAARLRAPLPSGGASRNSGRACDCGRMANKRRLRSGVAPGCGTPLPPPWHRSARGLPCDRSRRSRCAQSHYFKAHPKRGDLSDGSISPPSARLSPCFNPLPSGVTCLTHHATAHLPSDSGFQSPTKRDDLSDPSRTSPTTICNTRFNPLPSGVTCLTVTLEAWVTAPADRVSIPYQAG